jgi:[acyl-carrier-protein] S-malonyltransferase
MLVIVAPGQGAQMPGFLSPWLELPGVPEQLAAWSELAGRDLVRCGTTADADEIRDTATAQPLLVAAAIAAAGALFGHIDEAWRLCGAVAGHSVGELAAGAIAGVLSPDDAMRLVRVRGEAMARAAATEQTGMTAVLGGNEADVLSALGANGLTPANVNSPGQIVAAGTMAQLAALAADPPAGARLRPLQVAGAFHTHHMAPATGALRGAAAGIAVSDPRTTLLSNRDGAAVRTGTEWLDRIVAQVSEPVRWDACMRTFAGLGVSAIIELPPAGTLTGLARRALPGAALLALKTPAELEAARSLVAAHAVNTASHTPEWRLLVAPLAGTFHGKTGETGMTHAGQALNGLVKAGAELGHVDARGGRHSLLAPCAGHVVEWLVEEADPVNAGQPIVRLQPETAE